MLPKLSIRRPNYSDNPQQCFNQKSFSIIKPYVRYNTQRLLLKRNRSSKIENYPQSQSISLNKLKPRKYQQKSSQNYDEHNKSIDHILKIPKLYYSFRTRRYEAIQKQFQSMNQNQPYFQKKCSQNFIEMLIKLNPFIKRIGKQLSQLILQRFTIKSYKKKDIVYKEDEFSKQVYIMLWGELVLKNKTNIFTKYADPGDCLAEDLIVNQNSHKIKFKGLNAYYKHTETAKVLTTSGILLFSLAQYRELREELVPLGFRRQLKMFQNLLLCSHAKKIKFKSKGLQ